MGDKADGILQSFNLSEENLESYKTVKERFDIHFIQRRNTVFEELNSSSIIAENKNWVSLSMILLQISCKIMQLWEPVQ